MDLNIEEERERLSRFEGLRDEWRKYGDGIATYSFAVELVEQTKRTITALEQLEQAREALERISETETDWRQSLDANMEGVRTVAYQALKQQEVGND